MIRLVSRSSFVIVSSSACVGAMLASTANCGGITSGQSRPDAATDASGTADDGLPPVDASVDASVDVLMGCGLTCDGGDASTPLTACPGTPPLPESACTPEGEVCEYGSSWWLECNHVLRCQLGQWRVTYDGTAPECSSFDAGGPCPATWDEAMAVDAATLSCPFVTCVYPQGFCGCGIGCGGGGGVTRPQIQGVFTCIPASATCPEPRPLSGTSCATEGTYCSYGFACGCGQDLQCSDGIWQANASPPCP
jgi:hypothetical protein